MYKMTIYLSIHATKVIAFTDWDIHLFGDYSCILYYSCALTHVINVSSSKSMHECLTSGLKLPKSKAMDVHLVV